MLRFKEPPWPEKNVLQFFLEHTNVGRVIEKTDQHGWMGQDACMARNIPSGLKEKKVIEMYAVLHIQLCPLWHTKHAD
jgi:hypothetical protein